MVFRHFCRIKDSSIALTIEIRVVWICARLEEDLGEVVVSILRRQVERRQLVRVVLVDLGARLDQVLSHLGTRFSSLVSYMSNE